MGIIDENTDVNSLSDEQVNEVINSGYEATPPMADSAPTEQVQSNPLDDFKFNANKQEVVPESIDQLKQWASMGYNYSQHMQDIKSRQQQFDDKFSYYEQIEKQAQDNPDWWQHVQNSYSQLSSGSQSQESNRVTNQENDNPALQEMQGKINQMQSVIDSFSKQQETARREIEDQQLDKQVTGIKESYQDLDWKSYDPNGRTLEDRVLLHAQQLGTNSFEAAFKDLLFDDLVSRAETRGLEKAGATLQRNKTNGLLGETPAPLKSFDDSNTDISKMSYDDLVTVELKKLG
jgi:hypothetical protein